jgi:hypothetical protein
MRVRHLEGLDSFFHKVLKYESFLRYKYGLFQDRNDEFSVESAS